MATLSGIFTARRGVQKMSNKNLELLLAEYVNAATDLAEAVKIHVTKDTKINETTVVKLNKFIIAANGVAFFTDALHTNNLKFN